MKLLRLLLMLFVALMTFPKEKIEEEYIYNIDLAVINDLKYFNEIKAKEEAKGLEKEEIINEFYGTITAYSPYCEGCIGITASGYDVRNTIYYNDNEYGKIRIIAADFSIPFGTIIKISNLNNTNSIITIVLDRGGAIGYDTQAQVDLLFSNDYDCIQFGRQYDIKFEILRDGF